MFLVSSEVLSLRLAERVRGNDGAWSIGVIPIGWPVNVSVHSPVVALQVLQLQSLVEVTTKTSSKENTALHKRRSSGAISVLVQYPVVTSHIFAVPSREAVSARVPSDENSAEVTKSPCPDSVTTHAAVVAFHIFAVKSRDAVNTEA